MFQLGSALLDACVLAVVSKDDAYGYLLTQEIRNIIDVSESTLYPVLRRLQSEEMLVTYDSNYNGRNRRYYQITPRGHEHLKYLQDNWQHFKEAVDYLLIVAPSFSGTRAGQETEVEKNIEPNQETEVEKNSEPNQETEVEKNSAPSQETESEKNSEPNQNKEGAPIIESEQNTGESSSNEMDENRVGGQS